MYGVPFQISNKPPCNLFSCFCLNRSTLLNLTWNIFITLHDKTCSNPCFSMNRTRILHHSIITTSLLIKASNACRAVWVQIKTNQTIKKSKDNNGSKFFWRYYQNIKPIEKNEMKISRFRTQEGGIFCLSI